MTKEACTGTRDWVHPHPPLGYIINIRMVPDNTVNKGTSRHFKMDENQPFCGARFFISFFGLKSNYITKTITHSKN